MVEPACPLCGSDTLHQALRYVCRRCRVRLDDEGRFRPQACQRGHVNEDSDRGTCWGEAHSWCGMPTYDVPQEAMAAWTLGGAGAAAEVVERMALSGEWRPWA